MNAGCQVDFYVLGEAGQSAEHLACRLALMAWEQGHRIAVVTGDETLSASLDELMWDYPPGRLLPHAVGDSVSPAAVCIERNDSTVSADRDVLINLSPDAVDRPERFARLLEIVPGDEAQRAASRRKFREYRGRGLEPVSHTIGKT